MDNRVRDFINNSRELIIELQDLLTSHPALGPDNGGDGEYNKSMALKNYLSEWGFDSIEQIDIKDDRVSQKIRPSLIATILGEDSSKSLWIISHLDVVPPGDINLWNSEPYKIKVVDDKIYGRGTEDNQQGIVASLVAGKSIIVNKIKPNINVKLLFVTDEELGSDYGIIPLIEMGLFKVHDLILTPDVGDPEGKYIEIAEKSILWLEFTITGKQSHGSRPDLGINAARASSKLDMKLSELYKLYDKKDYIFDIPYSTFEPTKRIGSVQNFNTIPGNEVLCYDCRIVPAYNLDDVLNTVSTITNEIEKETGTTIKLRIAQKVQAPKPTDEEADIVKMLKKSIKNITGIDAKTYGIGGGTVAAYFRKKNLSAALWSTLDNTMHSPNEYSSIKNTIQDSLVFSELMQLAK